MRTKEEKKRTHLLKSLNVLDLVNVKLTANGTPAAKQPLTQDNAAAIIEKLGYSLRFNVMTHQVEFFRGGEKLNDEQNEHAFVDIEDALTLVNVPASNRLGEILVSVAKKEAYHPMQDWVASKAWDGTDRLEALCGTVPTDSVLWPVYLRKWLIQSIQAINVWVLGEEHSIPHVLVFCGGQGSGKGRWLRSLAPGFVLPDAELHLSVKDSLIQTLEWPLVELAEIDSTFRKSDVSALKAFLSRGMDMIRHPYGRRYIRRQRMTVFCGSVNDNEFLNDPTGARRFWPVELMGDKLEWDHGIDVQQVFAQADALWDAGEDWNLSDDEEWARSSEAGSFTMQAAAVDLASAWWEKWHGDFSHYSALNKTEIMRMLNVPFNKPDAAALTIWLNMRLGKEKRLNVSGSRKNVSGSRKNRSWAWPCGSEVFRENLIFMDESDAKECFLRARK